MQIVDLIRNDLNLVCENDSVNVPSLMCVESFATVHQLVSTVQGKLRAEMSSVDALATTFPPGSMTGAPKIRSVEILERLEQGPRGLYSGVLGFLSIDSVAAEFNVVIRTLVFNRDSVSVGAGGAVIYLSDPEQEFEEMLLKADSCLPSVEAVFRGEKGCK